jgi:Lamin Tail Domain
VSRTARILVALAAALTAVSLVVPAASGAIRITRIYYNSPGADTGSNASLNAEWIRIRNTGSTGRWLTNWRIRDASGHTYRFGSYKLRAGRAVTIHTGNGTNTARHRYWRSGNYIWNNTSDTARLRRPNGALVDVCHYNNSSASQKVC